MVVISMQNNKNLIKRIKDDYPEYTFKIGKKFSFRPPRTICLGPDESSPFTELLILHEVAHAVLGHRNFRTDIERLRMEVAAWEKARELATEYGVDFDEELAQNELDSYRDWLHKKSRCPSCGLTRFQDADGYHCPRCENLK